MKSCVEWRKSFKYLPEIDEFNIEYKRKDEKLLKFLDQYGISQRVNIYLPVDYMKSDLDLLIEIAKLGKYKIAIVFNDYYGDKDLNRLKENKIDFYYSKVAVNWSQLWEICARGVSDVFIGGELGFDLKRVAAAVGAEIQIRAYANITQYNSNITNYDTFKGFFIRPEDVDAYSEYINIIEFYNSEDKQNILYDIYFKDRVWDGKLREVIQGLKDDINNYYILDKSFSTRRSNCDLKCLKGEKCNLCNNLRELANVIEASDKYDIIRER